MCTCGCFQVEHGIRRTREHVDLADGGGVGGGWRCKDVL